MGGPTCFKNPQNPSSIDLMLTNKPRSFQNNLIIETGLFDHHKMTINVMRSFFPKQAPVLVRYREVKKMNKSMFRRDLYNSLRKMKSESTYEDL